jgi:hypothetical protein
MEKTVPTSLIRPDAVDGVATSGLIAVEQCGVAGGRFVKVLARAAGVLVGLLISLQAATAQVGAPDDKQRFDGLFQQLLAQPANLDANFEFAEVATKLGDYEAAIGAYERMLYYNPNLPRVRLELGLLYFRLGAYPMARVYFENVIGAAGVPAEVSGRAKSFLVEIDRRLQTTQWSFFGQLGLRHQSNANAGPSSPLVRAIGLDATLDRRFVKRPDWNAFGVASLRHVYDFENQRGDVWETVASTYLSRQFKVTRLDVGLVELQSGPRLALFPDFLPGSYVRPYGLVNYVGLGNASYLGTIGAGLGVGFNVAGVQVEPFYEVRNRRFQNSSEYRTATEQNGRLTTTGVVTGGALYGPVRWQSRIAFARSDTQELFSFYSYRQWSADFAFPIEFEGPWGARPWVATPFVGVARSHYDSPNALVDPNTRRKDRERRIGAGLEIPVWDNVGFGALVSYSDVDSNIRNYKTRNLAVSFGPTLRF